jgi:hypothetical protein
VIIGRCADFSSVFGDVRFEAPASWGDKARSKLKAGMCTHDLKKVSTLEKMSTTEEMTKREHNEYLGAMACFVVHLLKQHGHQKLCKLVRLMGSVPFRESFERTYKSKVDDVYAACTHSTAAFTLNTKPAKITQLGQFVLRTCDGKSLVFLLCTVATSFAFGIMTSYQTKLIGQTINVAAAGDKTDFISHSVKTVALIVGTWSCMVTKGVCCAAFVAFFETRLRIVMFNKLLSAPYPSCRYRKVGISASVCPRRFRARRYVRSSIAQSVSIVWNCGYEYSAPHNISAYVSRFSSVHAICKSCYHQIFCSICHHNVNAKECCYAATIPHN